MRCSAGEFAELPCPSDEREPLLFGGTKSPLIEAALVIKAQAGFITSPRWWGRPERGREELGGEGLGVKAPHPHQSSSSSREIGPEGAVPELWGQQPYLVLSLQQIIANLHKMNE